MRKPLLLFLVIGAASVAVSLAQTRPQRPHQELMREKLALSQKILEGIAVEDFALIATKSTRLSAMSQDRDWRVVENPEYDQQSRLFRRQADALVKSAQERNIDSATLAYVRLTMSCVDCHKFIRGKLSAQLGTRPSTFPSQPL